MSDLAITHEPQGKPRALRSALAISSILLASIAIGCPDSTTGPQSPTGSSVCNEVCKKWIKRATDELRAGDLDDASDSIAKAEALAPGEIDSKMLAGNIALARLDTAGAIKALDGVNTSEAAGLRARAYWYADDLGHTAEELTRALEDPDYKDPWAKPVRELAGTQGAGRRPFEVAEGSARLVEIKMPRDLGYQLMVPCEIDGQATVALVVTGVPEVVLDSKGRTSPGWVTFKFSGNTTSIPSDRSIEFRDVPALVQDLSAYTAQQTVPVGALIGVNFLRRMHLTIDRRADQIVIRREDPPPPPSLTRVPVTYVRGGAMVLRATLRQEFEITSGLWLDSGSGFAAALPDETWKKLGVDVRTLTSTATGTHGRVTDLHVGGLDLGPVEAAAAVTGIDERMKQLDEVEIAGALGAGFVASMRLTVVEGGRALWLETDPDTSAVLAPDLSAGSGTVAPVSTTPPPATSASPTGSSKPAPAPSSKPAPAPSSKPAPAPSSKPPATPSTVVAPPPAASSSTAH